MNMQFICNIFILLSLSLWTCVQCAEENSAAALAECGNLHHLEFHNIPNAEAVYSNSNCALKCAVGDKTLSNDALNEGFACPLNANGICHNGQCVESGHSNNDALRECGNLHHIDFLNQRNTGTMFSESQCFLKCVLNGATISSNTMNEGYPCPENHSGICRNGLCVGEPHGQPTTQPPAVTVTTAKTTAASHYKVDQINVQIVSASLLNNVTELGLVAAACVEYKSYPNHFSHCTANSCITPIIHHVTGEATWAHNCQMRGPFVEEYFLSVGLYKRPVVNGVYTALGFYVRELHALIAEYEPLVHLQSGHLLFNATFPILDTHDIKHIADFDLRFNLTLSSKV